MTDTYVLTMQLKKKITNTLKALLVFHPITDLPLFLRCNQSLKPDSGMHVFNIPMHSYAYTYLVKPYDIAHIQPFFTQKIALLCDST